MELGEYVSVSTQRDSERALLAQETRGFAELVSVYRAKGLGPETAALSARIGGGAARSAVVRVLIGEAAGLATTYAFGHLFRLRLS